MKFHANRKEYRLSDGRLESRQEKEFDFIGFNLKWSDETQWEPAEKTRAISNLLMDQKRFQSEKPEKVARIIALITSI